ncbi:DUF6286 domain-containing protein [Nocardia arizonensis]|uniref:DUF6286 domain-containing protein n=1 Tax=Nocardia arizonensis TaxID=1141647 RepID=UPI000A522B69|nr:DUF6286 domain-containing protein [Nocardia arizonensis]
MIRRSRRVIPAVVVAIVVLALCVAVSVSLIQRMAGARQYLSYDTVATRLHDLTWGDYQVLIAGVAVALLGLLALGAALWPGRAAVLPLSESDEVRAGVSRAGLRTSLRTAAAQVEGLESVRVELHRKTVTVRGQAWQSNTDGIAEEVCAAVTRRVQELGPPVRRVRARLRGPRTKRESS